MNKLNNIIKKFILINFMLIVAFFGIKINKVGAITKTIKITILGDYASGKTAFRHKICQEDFDFVTRDVTDRSNCVNEIIDYDETTKLLCQIWDTSGKSSVKEQILNMRITNSHFIVLTIDLSEKSLKPGYDNSILQAMGEWYPKIRAKCPNSKIILVGTKIDKITNPSEREQIDKCFSSIRDQHFGNIEYLIASALTGEGIDDFFDIIKATVDISKALPMKYTDFGAEDDTKALYLTCKRTECKKSIKKHHNQQVNFIIIAALIVID